MTKKRGDHVFFLFKSQTLIKIIISKFIFTMMNFPIPYLFTYLIKKFCRVYPDSDFWNKWVKTFFITWKFIMVNINLEIIILIKVWLLNKKKTWLAVIVTRYIGL
jgi:hypothetical protein